MAQLPTDLSRVLSDARAGSAAALGELLDACRTYLLAIAERELDEPLQAKAGASDLVQETFIDAQRDFPRFRGTSEGELLAWLRRMLLNNLGNFARHYRGTDKRQINRELFIDPHASETGGAVYPANVPTPSQQIVADEQNGALTAAMQRLPAEYREVLTLRYVENRSFDEVASALGRTNNAVRHLWVRAVMRLREEMGSP